MALEFTRKGDRQLHPAGQFKARLIEVKEDNHQEFGKQARLTFETDAEMENGDPFTISTWAKPSLHPKSKITSMLMGAWGFDPAKLTDEEVAKFDLEEFVNKKLQIVVVHAKKEKTDEIGDKITAYLPYKAAEVKRSRKFDEDDAAPETSGDRAAAKEEPQRELAAAGAPAGKKPNWGNDD